MNIYLHSPNYFSRIICTPSTTHLNLEKKDFFFFVWPQNRYGGSIPSSPPEYDNLYDSINGNGINLLTVLREILLYTRWSYYYNIGIEYPLHDELLQMCRATGLEAIATDSGIIKNGEISVLKDYSSM